MLWSARIFPRGAPEQVEEGGRQEEDRAERVATSGTPVGIKDPQGRAVLWAPTAFWKEAPTRTDNIVSAASRKRAGGRGRAWRNRTLSYWGSALLFLISPQSGLVKRRNLQ